LLSEKLAMSGIFPKCSTLEPDKSEKRLRTSPDQDFNGRVIGAPPFSLPNVPSARKHGVDITVFEFDRYEHPRRAMKHRIRAHEEPRVWIDPQEERRVEMKMGPARVCAVSRPWSCT
jgi:hypothetical protein